MRITAFIAQPTRGKTANEMQRERVEARREIECNSVFDLSFYYQFVDDGIAKPKIESLIRSLITMNNSDIVYFCKGWDDDRECRILHIIASEYGRMRIMYDVEC